MGGTFIKTAKWFKLLGVFISNGLTWGAHWDYITEKANRRLCYVRQLKKCGVKPADLTMAYCFLIGSVLEYASSVFFFLFSFQTSAYLSNDLESIQRHALLLCSLTRFTLTLFQVKVIFVNSVLVVKSL